MYRTCFQTEEKAVESLAFIKQDNPSALLPSNFDVALKQICMLIPNYLCFLFGVILYFGEFFWSVLWLLVSVPLMRDGINTLQKSSCTERSWEDGAWRDVTFNYLHPDSKYSPLSRRSQIEVLPGEWWTVAVWSKGSPLASLHLSCTVKDRVLTGLLWGKMSWRSGSALLEGITTAFDDTYRGGGWCNSRLGAPMPPRERTVSYHIQ